MSTVRDFYNYIDSLAPFEAQEEWDNSGMLVGDMDAEVTKVAVMLDITVEAVSIAAKAGADLIISHHPVIFKAMKSFTKGSLPFELATNSINAICCHTPLDIANGGTNDTLAELLGIKTYKGENPILRFADIPNTTASELACKIAKALGTKVRFSDAGKTISKIAICTGAGCSLIGEAGRIDAFITGDASHHDFLDALNDGITLIAAGHYETEHPVIAVLADKLRKSFPNTEIIEINEKNPIKFTE